MHTCSKRNISRSVVVVILQSQLAHQRMFVGTRQVVKNPFEAAACMRNAATMYKKVDNKKAVRPLEMTMEIFASISKFPQACKAAMECGELLEKEVVDVDAAIGMYEKAVDYAQMDGQSQSSENKANVKLAGLLAQSEQWARAIEIYEQIAESYVMPLFSERCRVANYDVYQDGGQ